MVMVVVVIVDLSTDIGLKRAYDECYQTNRTISSGPHVLTIQQKYDEMINIAYIVYW